MGLGVAVEGLASHIDIEQDKAEKERLKKLQDFLLNRSPAGSVSKRSPVRIIGLVGRLTSVRAIDRMNWLADHGGADPAHVKAWHKLRNRGVHPARNGDKDVASLDFQKMIDELHQVTVLHYHIVFHVIGYRGPYTDYATQNFPAKNYPLA